MWILLPFIWCIKDLNIPVEWSRVLLSGVFRAFSGGVDIARGLEQNCIVLHM